MSKRNEKKKATVNVQKIDGFTVATGDDLNALLEATGCKEPTVNATETVKTDVKPSTVAQMHKALESTEQISALEKTAQALCERQAMNEHEALVAACAICLDRLTEYVKRETLITLTNEHCAFAARKSNEVPTATDRPSYDFQRAVHRSYSARVGANVAHTFDALLDVQTTVGSANKHRLQALRVSASAVKILSKYRDSITAKNGR